MSAVFLVLPFVLAWLLVGASIWYGFRIVRGAARLLEKRIADSNPNAELEARVQLLEQELDEVRSMQRRLSESADFQAELLKGRDQP